MPDAVLNFFFLKEVFQNCVSFKINKTGPFMGVITSQNVILRAFNGYTVKICKFGEAGSVINC